MHKLIIGLLLASLSCTEDNPSKTPQNGANNQNNGESNNATSGTNNVVVDGPSIRAPQEVLFPRIDPVTTESQNEAWELIEVANRGTEPLVIYRVEIAGLNSPYSVSYPASASDHPSQDSNVAPGTVSPIGSFFIRVYFNPTSRAYAESNLVIITNDPSQPETLVQMRGNFGPCLDTNTEPINFGSVAPGESAISPITLTNCSPDLPLEVSSVEITGATFRLASSPNGLTSNGGVIPPNSSSDILVSFAPTELGVFEGEIIVKLADSESHFSWSLAGTGYSRDSENAICPSAIAMARIQEQNGTPIGPYRQQINTIPLKYIGFDGTQSRADPNGSIAEYEWTIIQRPPNSNARLDPSNTIPKPTIFLDLAGTYIIELTLYDDLGLPNCDDEATRRVTINVVSNQDIHVELVWDTPTDPDQTDTFGTDLDLHYLHPSGRWNQAPYDIFWRNRTADWGAPGPADDPNLDIDDTDGAGPEIISHNNPQGGLVYQVGVFYYADKGFGPSYATLRIYIQGTQRYEWRNEYLAGKGVFWRAAAISWPSGHISAINQKQTGFPGN